MPSTQNVSLSGRTSSCSPLANTAMKMCFSSALPSSTGLASSATLQRCLLKWISTLWTVPLVFISSALRMLLLSTWTKIRLQRVFALFHGTGRQPLNDVDVPISLVTLIDVDVAIILFMHCSNNFNLSQIPCNYWQKESLSFFLWRQQRLSF